MWRAGEQGLSDLEVSPKTSRVQSMCCYRRGRTTKTDSSFRAPRNGSQTPTPIPWHVTSSSTSRSVSVFVRFGIRILCHAPLRHAGRNHYYNKCFRRTGSADCRPGRKQHQAEGCCRHPTKRLSQEGFARKSWRQQVIMALLKATARYNTKSWRDSHLDFARRHALHTVSSLSPSPRCTWNLLDPLASPRHFREAPYSGLCFPQP